MAEIKIFVGDQFVFLILYVNISSSKSNPLLIPNSPSSSCYQEKEQEFVSLIIIINNNTSEFIKTFQ